MEVINVYRLLKNRIERKTYTDPEAMQIMLDKYYFAHRITGDQYDELTELLASQQ